MYCFLTYCFNFMFGYHQAIYNVYVGFLMNYHYYHHYYRSRTVQISTFKVYIMHSVQKFELQQIQIKHNKVFSYFQLHVQASKPIISLNTRINKYIHAVYMGLRSQNFTVCTLRWYFIFVFDLKIAF